MLKSPPTILICLFIIYVLFSCKKNEQYNSDNTTPNINYVAPEGALPHLFSVSPTKKVFFAKGNLQYQASTNIWRFAENQWDTIGQSNMNRSVTYNGWIDLFWYGSSGYNGANPYIFVNDTDEMFDIISQENISQTNYDWGTYNQISNAENKTGLWRTLTYDELEYLLYNRAFIGYPFGLGNLSLSDGSEIVGMFIFPDDCDLHNDGYPSSNTIRMSETELDELGIVFLPYMCNMVYREFYHQTEFDNDYLSIYLWGSCKESYTYGHNIEPVDTEFVWDYMWPILTRPVIYYGGVRLVCDRDYNSK